MFNMRFEVFTAVNIKAGLGCDVWQMIIIVLNEPTAFIFRVEEVKNVGKHLHHILGNIQPWVRLDTLVLQSGTVRISIRIKEKAQIHDVLIPKQLYFSNGEYQYEHPLKRNFPVILQTWKLSLFQSESPSQISTSVNSQTKTSDCY